MDSALSPPAPVPAALAPTRIDRWAFMADLVRPHRGPLALSLGLNAVHGVAITWQTLTVKYVIDTIADASLSVEQRWWRLGAVVAAFLAVSLVGRMLVWHLGYRIFTRVREEMMRGLRSRFFRHVSKLCPRFHVRHNSGELYSLLFGTPINELTALCQSLALNLGGSLFMLLSMLAWVCWWDWPMALTLYATVLVNVAVMRSAMGRSKELTRAYQAVEGAVSGRVADLLRGHRSIKVHGVEEAVADDFDGQLVEIGAKGYDTGIKRHLLQMRHESVGYVAFAVLCLVAGWRYMDGHLTAGELAAFLAAFFAIQGPLSACFQIATQWGNAQASLERVGAVLAATSTTPDPAPGQALAPRPGEILFDRVTFAYADGSAPALSEVALRIPYGQRVALVGPSGAGKSTLAQLMLRLYDPSQGVVAIDGIDLRRCQGSQVRRLFGVVPQDPFLFRTTIRGNIAIAVGAAIDPGAVGDAAIASACRRANAWDFVSQAPQGLDTVVGEGGWTLSGGQRQRLAIARVLLGDPRFLIFDEATSALDTLSEGLIQDTLEREFAGRTAIFIAHRLATVKNCDRVIVIDRGRVIQDGAYADLAARPGMFRDLVEGQQLL